MQHVVTRPTTAFSIGDGTVHVHQVPVWQDNLVWLLVDDANRTAVAVDGPEAGPVLAWCEERGVRLTALLNTHTHNDHIGINNDLATRGLLEGMRVVGPASVARDVPGLTEPVDEGDRIQIGSHHATIMRTEGHIDGHISFVFDDVVFCGDTLFTGGCGYLFDGPPETMFHSLMRLAALPGATRVCCAHEYTQDNLRFAWTVEPGNKALAERIRSVWEIRALGGCVVPSTIEEERATNPFLRPGSPELMANLKRQNPDANLTTPADVFAATRALKDQKLYRSTSDTDLPLDS